MIDLRTWTISDVPSRSGYRNERVNGVYIDYDEARVVAFLFIYEGLNLTKLTKDKH